VNSTSNTRSFESGATGDADAGKLDYEGFYSPLVMLRYAQFMHKHRLQSDGKQRDSDNWQKGIPRAQYVKSLLRHVHAVWFRHRKCATEDTEPLDEALCAVIFNASGLLLEVLLERDIPDER